MILCKRCKTQKDTSEFRKDHRYKSGYGSWCIPCHRERNSSWAKENRDRLSKKSSEWRASNIIRAREINKSFKRRHAEKCKKAHAEWARKNRDKRCSTDAKHKAAKLRAVPTWADHDAINRIYKQAKEMREKTGERLHVDHIVPLQHPTVCGLHVPANLRIILGSENESKRNFWWPDMPESQPDLFIAPPPKPTQPTLAGLEE